MGDRKKISYTFKGPDAWHEQRDKVDELVKADTNEKHWACNKALPPTCYPPPLTTETIDKLKQLEGVVVVEMDDE